MLTVKRPADRNLVINTDPERRKCEVIGCRYYGVAVCMSRQTPEEHPQNYNQGAGKERVDGEMFVFSEEDLDEANCCLFGKITRIVNNL